MAKGVVPNGHAVPFHFYNAFMEHNGFYAMAKAMRASKGFATDTEKRTKKLAKFRSKILSGKGATER